MMLTPITRSDLPTQLEAMAAFLPGGSLARKVFDHIAATRRLVHDEDLALSQDPVHHRAAVALVRAFHMGVVDAPPTEGFTWDGQAVWVQMEPSVIIHDVAHYQLCAPERRGVWDFGLGAGPETGRRAEADAVMSVFGPARELEESLTSLLGILWEARLGQPAILAFVEQNWLEGAQRPHHAAYFVRVVEHLAAFGFISPEGWPRTTLRHDDDDNFLGPMLQAEAA